MRFIIAILLFSFSLLFSDNYYVATTGTDNASCSVSNPCANIQTAINLTSNGDVVIVSGGTYLENLLIETGITLKSADATDPAIIDGSSPETDPALWNGGSCMVIRTPRGASSRVTATVEDVHLTGGKGTTIIEDSNQDGDFDDVGDVDNDDDDDDDDDNDNDDDDDGDDDDYDDDDDDDDDNDDDDDGGVMMMMMMMMKKKKSN